ncbi:MAG: RagB/SusD family nutrient uptake outer membrane protein [Bacteroidaceae bacterium]|nr:RagB/SusD family nutrient uptake outer membrane protein [Bacteroidaceae bacterium]
MKKRLIYTMTFLLCGTFLFSSCNDMLNVDSNRVEYEFDDWTLNDSVFSVLGILKSVQNVGDRQVLINELRGDLVTVNEAKAVLDVQELSRFEYNTETNKYLDVKDYYSIINNCNIYLARVDTTLEKNNIRLMLPEYVAVKSVRAWTYLQLAINYNSVPYFTEPILTHSAAEDVLNKPMLTRDEIINKLIADILPYENPSAYPMPAWDKDGKVLKFGYGDNGTEVETKRLFVPIRMLLGELYLWKGDYKNAARFFYAQIAGTGTNETAKKYNDYGHKATYSGKGGKNMNNGYMGLFSAKNFDANSSNIFTIIPFANTDLDGTTSGLAAIFSPPSEVGAAQVVASRGIQSLSKRQVYRYYEGEDPKKPDVVEYSHFYEYTGDLRIKATTYSQRGNDDAKTEYKNIIGKFNFEDGNIGMESEFTSNIRTTFIILQRKEHAYLRLAEALVGLEREGYVGAMDLAMTILKVGVKENYQLLKNPVYAERVKLDADGDTLYNYIIENKDTIDIQPRMEKYLASCTDSLRYNFAAEEFTNNIGLHSRGSGDSERNEYYALTDTCIARYLGLTEVENKVETILRPITYEDSLNYIADLVIDELALEFAWEGTRFGDLIRFAKAMGDNDVLAKRVAGRAYENDVTYRSNEYQMDADLYGKLSNEANWYLPLPGAVVEPVDPEDIPTGELSKE